MQISKVCILNDYSSWAKVSISRPMIQYNCDVSVFTSPNTSLNVQHSRQGSETGLHIFWSTTLNIHFLAIISISPPAIFHQTPQWRGYQSHNAQKQMVATLHMKITPINLSTSPKIWASYNNRSLNTWLSGAVLLFITFLTEIVFDKEVVKDNWAVTKSPRRTACGSCIGSRALKASATPSIDEWMHYLPLTSPRKTYAAHVSLWIIVFLLV